MTRLSLACCSISLLSIKPPMVHKRKPGVYRDMAGSIAPMRRAWMAAAAGRGRPQSRVRRPRARKNPSLLTARSPIARSQLRRGWLSRQSHGRLQV